VLRARWLARDGQPRQALEACEALYAAAPAFFGLVAADYVRLARACGLLEQARGLLDALCAGQPSTAVLQARLQLDEDAPAVQVALLAAHLQRAPGLAGAQALLALPPEAWGEAGLLGLRAAVDRAATPLQRHRCAACGFEARHWFWQCPGCLGWDTFPPRTVEEL
jgi:lipopolysaccharide biosynthesis regulator YciM